MTAPHCRPLRNHTCPHQRDTDMTAAWGAWAWCAGPCSLSGSGSAGRAPRCAAAQQRLNVCGLAREHGAAISLRVGPAPQAQPRQRAVVGRRGQAGVERQRGAVALLRLRRCDTLYGRVGLTSSACAAIIWCQKGCRGERPATGYAHRPATAPCAAEQTACMLAAHTQAEAL